MKHDHPQQLHMDGSTRQKRLHDASIDLLRMTCPPEGFYLATSFGKDSIVAHQLCIEAGVKFDAHNNHTSVDPPELVRFGRKYYPDVERHYNGSMWRLILKMKMPPLRQVRYCCNVLKEDGGIGRTCVMGIRAAESNRRAKTWAPVTERLPKYKRHNDALRLFDADDISQTMQRCNMRDGKLIISPLFHWGDDDLWEYIRDRKLPYPELYDQGFDRLGCIGCPMATQRQREAQFARWPKYREAYVRTFDRLIAAGYYEGKGFADGEDIMRWWLQDRVQNKPLDGQLGFDLEDEV